MARKSINSRLARRLLATNDPPSAAEEAALEHIFDEIDGDISKAHQKIVRLRASLEAACEEHAQLLAARTAHRTILSPVRRLPSDVVFEVLRWSSTREFSPSNESLPIVTVNQDEAPWPFMSVCRHWRTIITSHSTFWSNIWITYPSNPSSFADSFHFILEHSKDAPLTIGRVDITPKLTKDFIRLLTPHSHRLTELNLDYYIHGLYKRLGKALSKGSVPQLRRLSLWQHLDLSLSCFEVAPNLQTLEVGSRELLSNLRLPWHQIQNLSICQDCPANEVDPVLQMMPNLVNFSLVLWNDENPGTTIRMPHLRCLKVSVSGRHSPCIKFLDCLEVPVLEKMNVGQSPAEIDAAAALIRRNACPISTLTILDEVGYHQPTVKELTSLSQSVPGLTKLTIVGSRFSIIELLRNNTIFPNLSDFFITTRNDESAITGTMGSSQFWAVTDIVEKRPCLRTLHISAPQVESRKAKRRFERNLQVFRARGLDASLDMRVPDKRRDYNYNGVRDSDSEQDVI